MSYELRFSCELRRVTVQCTGYELLLHVGYELLSITWVDVIIILSTKLGTPWFMLNTDNLRMLENLATLPNILDNTSYFLDKFRKMEAFTESSSTKLDAL